MINVCDKCGEKISDMDAGFSPAVQEMQHDCGGTWRRPPVIKNNHDRTIVSIFMEAWEADEQKQYWSDRNFRPRVYQRQIRAENMSRPVWVVVIDKDAEADEP